MTSVDLFGCHQLKSLGHDIFLGMPLSYLNLGGCRNLLSIQPFLGLPLTILNLEDCVRLESLLGLERMPLKSLSLAYCTQFINSSFEALLGLPLVDLDLSGCRFLTGEGLRYLSRQPLSSLILKGCDRVRDMDLVHLRELPLTDLSLEGCKSMDGSGLRFLQNAPLQKLSISYTYITGDNVFYYRSFYVPIKEVIAAYCPRFGLKGACKMYKLTSLDWSGSMSGFLVDEELKYLRGKPLTWLRLEGRLNMSEDGLEPLRGMPLVELDLRGCSYLMPTDASIGLLLSLSQLEVFGLPNDFPKWRRDLKKYGVFCRK